ncbi:MAG: YraN family protein [Blastocatellia bacterium]
MDLYPENKSNRHPETTQLGERGEAAAAEYLESQGYRIVLCNFTAPIGRSRSGAVVKGEIDIVALDGETLCFIEVKTRSTDDFADPLANVDRRKQAVIRRTARIYRRLFGLKNMPFRFDVITVVGRETKERKLRHFKNFWRERRRYLGNADGLDPF